jgi:hypothetical protein
MYLEKVKTIEKTQEFTKWKNSGIHQKKGKQLAVL